MAIRLARLHPLGPAPAEGLLQRKRVANKRLESSVAVPSGWAFWVVAAALGAGWLTIAFLRYQVLVTGGAPPTVDAGNWLAFGKDLVGPTLRPGSVYPPLIPLLVLGAVQSFGPLVGVAAVAVLASMAPAVALTAVLYRQRLGWWAPSLAALVLASGATGEMTAWGGFPQLFATGLSILFLWQWDKALRGTTIRSGLATGVTLGLVAGTSHLILVFALLTALVIWLGHVVFKVPHQVPRRRSVTLMVTAIAPSLVFVPTYLRLWSTVVASVAARTSAASPTVWLNHLEFVYRDAPILWRTLLVAGSLALLFLFSRRRDSLWLLSASMFVGAIILAVASAESRYLYLLQPAAILAIGMWIVDVRGFGTQAFRSVRRGAAAALVLALAAQVVLGLAVFPQQRDFYAVLRPGTVTAISWLNGMTAADAVIAVSRVREAPLGWWVEGLGRRPTLYATSMSWLNFPEEKRRTGVANDIFEPTFPSTEGVSKACRDGVSYVLVAKAWGGFDSEQLAAIELMHRGAVMVNNSDAVVLSMAALGCPNGRARG
jgi:hypothetical protein